jgi:hypothetical protein
MPAISRNAGSCAAQSSTAWRQRGWKAQPDGRAVSDGGDPSIAVRRVAWPSIFGSEASRPRV